MTPINNPGSPPTKEFQVLPALYYLNATPVGVGQHPALDMDAAAESIYFEFPIPGDFNAITSFVLVFIANATKTHRLNLQSNYFTVGEPSNEHSETQNDIDIVCTDGLTYQVDVSQVLSAIVQGDHVGLKVTGDAVNVLDIRALKLWNQYS